jgi:hypothetical protein
MAEEEQRTIESFDEFWLYYVGEHSDPTCRALHYLGTGLGTLTLFGAIYTRNWWLVPLALVLGYGPAWIAHFTIERNRPATFKYPLWSLMADFKMLALAIRGKMAQEAERLLQ